MTDLKQLAEQFARSNPRYMVYSIKFIDGALKIDGHDLSTTDLQTFLYHLIGIRIDVDTILEHLK